MGTFFKDPAVAFGTSLKIHIEKGLADRFTRVPEHAVSTDLIEETGGTQDLFGMGI